MLIPFQQTSVHKHSISSFFFVAARSSYLLVVVAVVHSHFSSSSHSSHDPRPVPRCSAHVPIHLPSPAPVRPPGSRRAANQCTRHPLARKAHPSLFPPAALAIASSATSHTEAEVAREQNTATVWSRGHVKASSPIKVPRTAPNDDCC